SPLSRFINTTFALLFAGLSTSDISSTLMFRSFVAIVLTPPLWPREYASLPSAQSTAHNRQISSRMFASHVGPNVRSGIACPLGPISARACQGFRADDDLATDNHNENSTPI